MAFKSLSNKSTLVFGILDQKYGYFDNLRFDESVSTEQSIGPAGDVERVHFYGREIAVGGNYTYRIRNDSPVSGPLGALLTGFFITLKIELLIDEKETDTWPLGLSGAKIYIKNVSHSYTRNSFKTIQFDGTYYPKLKNIIF